MALVLNIQAYLKAVALVLNIQAYLKEMALVLNIHAYFKALVLVFNMHTRDIIVMDSDVNESNTDIYFQFIFIYLNLILNAIENILNVRVGGKV